MFGWFKKKDNVTASPPKNGPDFTGVTSESKAKSLFRRGDLEKCLLMPPQCGGDDSPMNIVYVPVGVADIKANLDNNIIAPLAREGKIRRYVASPIYQGDSVVPIAIEIEASDPGQFSTRINIWGDALEENQPPAT